MAIFNRDPQKTMQRDIDAAKANLTRLRAQLAEAEAAILQSREQAKTVTGADSHVLDAAEGLIRSAQIHQETISAAVGEVESNLAALERAKSEAADRAQREQTAQSVELLARRVLETAEAMTKAAAAFAVHIEKASAIAPEAGGLLHFAHIVGREIPAAVEQTGKLLRAHAASVLRGDAAAVMPEPAPAYVPPPVAPREATTTLFCLRSVKWRDDQGQQKSAAQFTDASIPARLVGRALRIGACVGLDHPRRKENHTQGGQARLDTATDLDEPESPRLAEPLVHGAFEKPVIGEAKILKIQTR